MQRASDRKTAQIAGTSARHPHKRGLTRAMGVCTVAPNQVVGPAAMTPLPTPATEVVNPDCGPKDTARGVVAAASTATNPSPNRGEMATWLRSPTPSAAV